MTMNDIYERIHALAADCHKAASNLDIGPERTAAFNIAGILRKLPRRGYANEVANTMNPLLNHCDDDCKDDDDDE